MREAKRKQSQKERGQLHQQSKALQSLEEEALANARAFDRYDSMRTAKGRDTLHGMPQVKICGSLEARELKQPGRTVYTSSTPLALPCKMSIQVHAQRRRQRSEDVGVRSVRHRRTSDLDHILTDSVQGAQWRLLALSPNDRLLEVIA